jgi:tetratricopeptide (TPR) repeat protein
MFLFENSIMGKIAKHFLIMLGIMSLATSVYARISWEELNYRVNALYQEGQYSEAAKVAEEALKIAEGALGSDHPQVPAEAKPIYEKALAIADHLRAQGKYAEAKPLYEQTLAIDEKVLGKDHVDVARDLNNLALLYHAQGAYGEAEPLYERALAIVEKALGPDHPQVATLLDNLAELYQAQGMYAEAEPLRERALAIEKKASGQEQTEVTTPAESIEEQQEKPQTAVEAEKVEEPPKQIQSQVSVQPVEAGQPPEAGPQSGAVEGKKETKEKPSKPPVPSKRIFTVQAGAFRNPSHAKAFMTWLRGKGYSAYIILSGSKNGLKLHKVCIGKFTDRKKAKTFSEKIKSSEGLQTFVTSR